MIVEDENGKIAKNINFHSQQWEVGKKKNCNFLFHAINNCFKLEMEERGKR